MDVSSRAFGLIWLTGFCCVFAGCGTTEVPISDGDEDLLAALLEPERDTRPEPAESANDTASSSIIARESNQEVNAATHVSTTARGERLELRLQKGDRFPLMKTVEQTLEQRSAIAPAVARTRLELMLAITVEEVKSDAVLLGVTYSRVAYEHNVNGQRLSYDSANHQGAVPWDAIPYAGMIDNGFSFWLGRDNRIRELVGYQSFLERCVAEVPLERRQTLLSEISNRFGDDGVANFIDDSIGLLPYDSTVDADAATRVLPGDVWTRERRLMQPVPIYLTSTYRLTGINRKTAEIEILGRVASGEAVAGSEHGRLRIIGGHSEGHCSVDRATGLPLEMHLTRSITMKLTTSDNQEVTQEKQIVTTIRSFPETRGSVTGISQPPQIRQAGGTSNEPGRASFIPPNGGASSAVQAAYPN